MAFEDSIQFSSNQNGGERATLKIENSVSEKQSTEDDHSTYKMEVFKDRSRIAANSSPISKLTGINAKKGTDNKRHHKRYMSGDANNKALGALVLDDDCVL